MKICLHSRFHGLSYSVLFFMSLPNAYSQVPALCGITGAILKLSLTRTTGTLGSGRVSIVAVNHVFTFAKKLITGHVHIQTQL